ncbi:Uncharacterized conserved protein YgbK, DUF1537 family [Pasteurella testudinis DSM 23072]|uniref:Uncharacterized conserved protein YgbK, DUF1537 family n=1 Tax=Pasteurella testudinis DSM 23072 TaxID=1122938 RepID=A0A1W1V0B9_9PAST|nr:four-carbon acid sugar kinase family protein [Pasteurella testudinis]SMB86797.1 Uncharacterized conserved protein YgbK, DUF1537 family [Pasteurella testudinis DSM 23072]SUB50381.1 4-hydroxy-3-methylbut-2-enyl diphosphate reductase [Pasteurella testudinis]
MKMLVIADDFTGANDTGVQFCKKNAVVDVVLDWRRQNSSRADIIVINTDSRAMSVNAAADRINNILSSYDITDLTIYKKIDSTLRGNVGAEIEALLVASKRNIAFLCPALPSMGRTVHNGICYVDEVPILQTEYATDPKTPIISSNVRDILASQTALPIIEIDLETLRNQVFDQITKQMVAQYPRCIFSCDAQEEQDLLRIAEQIKRLEEPCIIAGSAGLAGALAETFCQAPRLDYPLLFVVASMSETSQQQTKHLLEQHLAVSVEVNIASLLTDEYYPNQLIEHLTEQLTRRQHVLFKTDSSQQARQGINALCKQLTLTRPQLGERICSLLSDIVNTTLQRIDYRLAGLVLTGGDIAIGVAQALQAEHYRIAGEVENGVPFGYLPHTALQDIPIITKAGGFGSPDVFKKVIHFIRNTANKER